MTAISFEVKDARSWAYYGFEFTAADRFWGKVSGDDPLGCWLWTAGLYKPSGYGCFSIGSHALHAHRWAYQFMVGEIPKGLHLDHLCRNRACVNPYHLDPVTPLVNTRRGEGHGSETRCRRGHEYAGDNLYAHKGRRYCRTCQRINRADYGARHAFDPAGGSEVRGIEPSSFRTQREVVDAGQQVRADRISLGLTQGQLALSASITPSYLSLIEAGKRSMSGEVCTRIAAALTNHTTTDKAAA